MSSDYRIIHSTDLEFSKFCERNYKINRGVYNTIDAWFYFKGEINILSRRKKIIQFLRYLKHNKDLSFGKGGLSHKLNEFCLTSKVY